MGTAGTPINALTYFSGYPILYFNEMKFFSKKDNVSEQAINIRRGP
jgi:hypothetical protein